MAMLLVSSTYSISAQSYFDEQLCNGSEEVSDWKYLGNIKVYAAGEAKHDIMGRLYLLTSGDKQFYKLRVRGIEYFVRKNSHFGYRGMYGINITDTYRFCAGDFYLELEWDERYYYSPENK